MGFGWVSFGSWGEDNCAGGFRTARAGDLSEWEVMFIGGCVVKKGHARRRRNIEAPAR